MDQRQREFEKKWDTMKRILGADAQGEELHGFGSTRTLFGIKSHAEEVIEQAARENEARCHEKLEAERARRRAEVRTQGRS